MKTTFILKDLSEDFYAGLAGKGDKEKYEYLQRLAFRKELPITQKVGSNNQFKEKVEFNILVKQAGLQYGFKLENRRGYKLATFEITK